MKKFFWKTTLMGLIVITAGFVSCSKDENGEDKGSYRPSDIAGSWELVDGYYKDIWKNYYKFGKGKNEQPEVEWIYVGGILVINPDGTGKSPTYYGKFNYTLKGNQLTCDFGGNPKFVIKEVKTNKLVLFYDSLLNKNVLIEEYIFNRVDK